MFLDYVTLNPKITLEKGKQYPFVEMAAVSTNSREPYSMQYKVYNGSGVKFEKGDTVIARITPCLQNGKRFFCDEIDVGFGSSEYLVFRPKNDTVDNRYLYYFMQTDFIKNSMINSMIGATGRQRVNNNVFNDLNVTFPEISIQEKIADILSAYDDLIENNRKQIKLFEEAAQRLYKEWFVDFRFPGHEQTKIVDGLPEGWGYGTLCGIADNVGKQVNKRIRDRFKYYLPIECIPKKSLVYTIFQDVNMAESSLLSFQEGDVIFGAMRPYFHKVVVARDNGLTRSTCFVINTKKQEYWGYLIMLMFNEDTINYATKISVGTTMPYVRWSDFEKMPVVIPTEQLCAEFSKHLKPTIGKLSTLAEQNIYLAQARDMLLPKLMSGEIVI